MADALLFAHYAQDEVLWTLVSRRYLEQHVSAFMSRSSGLVAAGEWAQLVTALAKREWWQTLAILL